MSVPVWEDCKERFKAIAEITVTENQLILCSLFVLVKDDFLFGLLSQSLASVVIYVCESDHMIQTKSLPETPLPPHLILFFILQTTTSATFRVCECECNTLIAFVESLYSVHRYPHLIDYHVSPLSVMSGWWCLWVLTIWCTPKPGTVPVMAGFSLHLNSAHKLAHAAYANLN